MSFENASEDRRKHDRKRKWIEDRAVDDEDAKNKKRIRKEEKRKRRQQSNGIRQNFRNTLRHLEQPQQLASTASNARPHSPEQGRKVSRPGHTAKTDRKHLQHDTRRKAQRSKSQEEHETSISEPADEQILRKDITPTQQASRQQGSRRPSDVTPTAAQSQREQKSLGASVIAKASHTRKKDNAEKRRRERSGVARGDSAWTLSSPYAGHYVDCPPIFTSDEKRLLFATDFQLGTYSTQTSVVESRLDSDSSGEITCFALSLSDPANVYVGTRKGYIVSWDWRRGKSNGRWMINTPVWCLACGRLEGSNEDTILTVDQTGDGWNVTAHRFGLDGDLSKTGVVTLLRHDQSIRSIRILENCAAIVALTPESMIIGKLEAGHKQGLKHLAYSWLEVPCKEPPTCLDVRFSPKKVGHNDQDDIDVVFGGLKGAIFYYRSLLSKIGPRQDGGKHVASRKSVYAPQMHWHREAVGAVAFSRDGDYLISGGRETVLVLWQLSTGRKQFLPHLESPIMSLAVSPSGAFYAILMGDNSVMVLSTSELKPTANYPSLQTPFTSNLPPHQLLLPTRELLQQVASQMPVTKIEAVIDPHNLDNMLCVVPASQHFRTDIFPTSAPRPYLQTFSLMASTRSRHVARQALARTNATNSNLGPEGNRLQEPNVVHMAITTNGQWLATVDEWTPPPADLQDLDTDKNEENGEARSQSNITLRIWKREYDETQGVATWQLNTRIDAPHASFEGRLLGRILVLEPCPNASGFASVGEDRILRIWKPKSRAPDGRVVWSENPPLLRSQKGSKRVQAKILTWWAAQHTVQLNTPASDESVRLFSPTRSPLAFSNDGSLIAVHLHLETKVNDLAPGRGTVERAVTEYDHPANTLVHLVDADFGKVSELRSDLCPKVDNVSDLELRVSNSFDGIHAFGFLDERLIVVTRHAAYVWDLTSFALLSTINLPSPHLKNTEQRTSRQRHGRVNVEKTPRAPGPQLAVNPETNSFAISSPLDVPPSDRTTSDTYSFPPHQHRDYTSRVSIFESPDRSHTTEQKSVFTVDTPRLVLSILNASASASAETDAENVKSSGIRDKGFALARRALARGYHFIDCAAAIRTLRPPLYGNVGPHMPDGTDFDFIHGRSPSPLETVDLSQAHELQNQPLRADEEEVHDHRPVRHAPVVSREKLASVFEPSAGRAMPTLKEMFAGVMKLYAGTTTND